MINKRKADSDVDLNQSILGTIIPTSTFVHTSEDKWFQNSWILQINLIGLIIRHFTCNNKSNCKDALSHLWFVCKLCCSNQAIAADERIGWGRKDTVTYKTHFRTKTHPVIGQKCQNLNWPNQFQDGIQRIKNRMIHWISGTFSDVHKINGKTYRPIC